MDSPLATALLSVYAGRRDVYGRQRVEVAIDDTSGEPHRTVRWSTGLTGPVTEALIEQHLAGAVTVGLYLLGSDSTARFAVWDLDSRDRVLVSVMRRACDELGVDVLLTDSGSKGYHLVAAFAEPVPGDVAYRFARAVWEAAGRPERVDVFPRQGAVTPERPYGNLVKLPLGIHRATRQRCAILTVDLQPVAEGTEIDELDGLRRLPPALVREIAGRSSTPERAITTSAGGTPTASGFVHTPYPCFAELSTASYGQGERDVLLFTLTKHLRQQGQPRQFADLVVSTQASRCRPPFGEWAEKVESVYTRGYSSFGCEEPAMARFCAGVRCPLYQRRHGEVTAATPDLDAEALPEGYVVRLGDLRQLGREEPVYELDVCGQRIGGLTVEQLLSWPRFTRAVTAALRFVPELPKVRGLRSEDVWRSLVNDALATSTLEERPGDAATGAEAVQAAIDYLRHGVDVSPERADVLKGAAYDDGEYRSWLARFMHPVVRAKAPQITQRELYNLLHAALGVRGANVKIAKQSTWVWRVPLDALENRG